MSNIPYSDESVRKLVERVGIIRIALLFLAVQVPIAILLSIAVALTGPSPTTVGLVIRFVAGLVAFVGGGILFLWLVSRAGRSQKG